MRSGYATLAVVGVAACIAVYSVMQTPTPSSSLYHKLTTSDMEFLKHVTKFGKSYGTHEEFALRADIFKTTLAKISEENSKNDNTFRLAVNKFADWTPEEYSSLLGYKSSGRTKNTRSLRSSFGDIPAPVDWRTKGAVNAIKD